MRDEKGNAYAGIDVFRLVSALLVITVHTAPLLGISGAANFALTRVVARVAVPFFFMTSGFFLFAGGRCDKIRLKKLISSTALLYAVSILIYLPINIYNGYFNQPFISVFRDIVFEGTLYHLWYLPALMLGAAIAWYLADRRGFGAALAVSVALYVVGLFGDSYYSLAMRGSAPGAAYNFLLEVFRYTRNGLFFAPLFFVMSGIAARGTRTERSRQANAAGFAVSLALMLCEGFTLRHFKLQRHDSMYILLPICMMFLFPLLASFRGGRVKTARDISVAVYIIHPWVIVLVRALSRQLGLFDLLAGNNLVHFAVVTLLSFGIAMIYAWLKYYMTARKKITDTDRGRCWIEIDPDNLRHNADTLRAALPEGCELMAVVKDNAYGHGAVNISRHMNSIGVKAFAVATADEGIELRRSGVKGEILILGYTPPERAGELARYRLAQSIIGTEYARELERRGKCVDAHLAVDTGMHRLGVDAADVEGVKECFNQPYLRMRGIYTHLCAADSREPFAVEFTNKQISNFYALLDALERDGMKLPKAHVQSSYGLLNYPELHCDYVRAGIAIYGALDTAADTVTQVSLKPVLSLRSKIALVREVKRGERVGYGCHFTAEQDIRIAIVPIGYGDGVPRQLSCGKGGVLVNGCRAPIIGMICMDQLTIDVTNVPDARSGDTATFIGRDGLDEITAAEMAGHAGTIPNELLSRLGSRVPRVSV